MDTEVMKPADLSGQVIGSYHITSRLGRGGMADVYKALHTELQVHRAVKFIRPEFVTSEDFVARFQKEAQAVAQLEHPNIVRIHDFGNANNQFYMVMQFVEGMDLKNSLAATGPLSAEDAIDLIIPVANALTYAHDRDLIHRDIKPDNIMLGKKGEPILMDFGIAKLLTENTALTQTGIGIGTPAYMAPEQAQALSITPATDIYALSVVLYELVTGRQPFSADTPMAVMLKAIADPLPLPRDINPAISEELQAVILKGTAKDPNARYQSAEEFAADLKNVRGGSQPTIARKAPVAANAGATTVVNNVQPKPPGFIAKVVRGMAWLGGVSVLLAAAAGYWWWNSRDAEAPASDIANNVDGGVSASAQTSGQNEPDTTSVNPGTTASPATPQSTGGRQSVSAPAAPTPKNLTTKTLSSESSGELFAWRDTLEAGQSMVSEMELTKGDYVYLRVHDTDSTADFVLEQPGTRDNLFSRHNDSGPVEVKVSGTHKLVFKTRNGKENAVDMQLFRINPYTLDSGKISFNDYISATSDWPGQRLNYQAEFTAGDSVYLEVSRTASTTDFAMRTFDDRSDLFSYHTDTGPHEIPKSGTYQFFADPRGASLADIEFVMHKLNPAVIVGGAYNTDTWAEANTSQPGQSVEYTIELEAKDVVYLEVSRSSVTTDFILHNPGRRSQVFSDHTDTGPHEVKRGGTFTLEANPRGRGLAEFEFKLHKLSPAIIAGGDIALDETISAGTKQPGQIVSYNLTLTEETSVAFNLVSSSATTDFTLIEPGGRKNVFSYSGSVGAKTLAPGTYEFRIDPRGRKVSDVEFRMAIESTAGGG